MAQLDQTTTFYIGTYTDNQTPAEQRSQGIYQAQLDLRSGAINDVRPVAAGVNACFLVLSPDRRFLYAAGDGFAADQATSGVVGAFMVDAATDALRLFNQTPAPGDDPAILPLMPPAVLW